MNRLYVFFSPNEYAIYTDIYLLLDEYCVYLKDSKTVKVVIDADFLETSTHGTFLLFASNRASYWACYEEAKFKVPYLDEYINTVKALELIRGEK